MKPHVHHKNGNLKDNRVENVYVCRKPLSECSPMDRTPPKAPRKLAAENDDKLPR